MKMTRLSLFLFMVGLVIGSTSLPLSASPSLSSVKLSMVKAARKQIGQTLSYDPSYVKIAYPLGDVPIEKGVCTDVVIRALRSTGIDLQETVAQSISKNVSDYKRHLTSGRADKNIDHRRVKVLATYFRLEGLTQDGRTYEAGDILVFDLGRGIWHIAIVSDTLSFDKTRPLVIHNICSGAKEEAIISQFPVLFCFRLNESFLKKFIQ